MNSYLMDHFTPELSQEIKDFAIDTAFLYSRYIVTQREGKQQYGYCTHCGDYFKSSGLTHNQQSYCPGCGSKCTVKASGRGHSKLVDDVYFVYYEKSVKDPNVMVARGIYAVRDYSGNGWQVETKYLELARYVFKMGDSAMLSRYGYYSMAKTMEHGAWEKRRTVYSLFSKYWNARRNIFIGYSLESVKNAVAGTPFQYSTWEEYNSIHNGDLVKLFDLYSRYPCVEYLSKLGFNEIVQNKLEGDRTYGSINWRGKNLFQVLKITKKDLNEIKAQDIRVTPLYLRLLQMSKKDGSNLSNDEINRIDSTYGYYTKELASVLKYTTLRSADIYINKQMGKLKKHYNSQHQVLTAWRDYINDCIHLGMNLNKKSVLCPRNLYKAHQNTNKQVKIKASAELEEKIKIRASRLAVKYCFEHKDLLIRPCRSATELIEEGSALEHCVGTYAGRYAAGQTIILLIRKKRLPDVPYYTVELRENTIYQCRGLKNKPADKPISELLEAFKASKLQDEKGIKERNACYLRAEIPA